ncbi:hypothetical protein BURKHO8Y_270013 [Burkholderia sp. 8Y]|nr:hypothetical protein BURKHO8Y_270013 [Burkholderia sp. 8Y]
MDDRRRGFSGGTMESYPGPVASMNL